LSNPVVTGVMPPVLRVSKRADRSAAIPGDGVVFAVTVAHTGTETSLTEVTLTDVLPAEMRYVAGSARLDGDPAPDPVVGPGGRALRFDVGPMAPGDVHELVLAVVLGPASRTGAVVNEVFAEGGTPGGGLVISPPAFASVTVVPGPFRREAVLVGRVFIDDDGDGQAGPGEPGVPGAMILMEDGRGARTDITGRWHIDGVRPGLHVVRVDPASLPESVMPLAAGADWAGDRSTRFIEARPSTLVVTDFPMGPGEAPRCTLRAGPARLDLPAAHLLDRDGRVSTPGGVHLDAASDWFLDGGLSREQNVDVECAGIVGSAQYVLAAAVHDRILARGGGPTMDTLSGSDTEPSAEQARVEGVLRTSSNRPAILAPAQGAVAERGRIDVEVLFPDDAVPHLSVNGNPVDPARIGERSDLECRHISLARYVGIRLEPGANLIAFRAAAAGIDPLSVPPVTTTVLLPGEPVELRARAPGGHWIADGVTPAVLVVEAVDAAGVPSPRTLVVTVAADGMMPLSTDVDVDAEGFQARIRDGRAEIRFAPPTIPGRAEIRVATDTFEYEAAVEIHAGSGSWRIVGMAEARLAGDAGVEGDGGVAPGVDDGISDSDGRLAFFASGPVGKASRLTLSVDTDRKRDRDRLERDFAPDTFYPAVGDSSTNIDEAASQGKLFARLDGPRGWARWGDFATGFARTELTRYDRRMTGAAGSMALGRFNVEGFATSTDQQSRQDIFEADGSSGPYLLTGAPVIVRSESVIVEVRDRFETDKVVSRQIKRRDVEYSLDPVSGTLLFSGPVQAVDAELNPVRIVVSYETRGSAGDQLTGGTRISFAGNEAVELAATAIFEERQEQNLGLYGFDMVWRPGPGTLVKGEVGISDAGSRAQAVQLEIKSRPRTELGWELSYRDLDGDYANPGYLGHPELGSRRWGGSFVWQPVDLWRIRGEAFAQDDRRTGFERTVAGADAERRIGALTVLAGLKRVETESPTLGRGAATMASAGVRGSPGDRWTAELIREEAIGGDNAPGYPSRTSAGVAYRMRDDLRLFLRQEFQSGDGPERDRTVAGVEGRSGPHTKASSKYTLECGLDSSSLRALTGVETLLPLDERNSIRFAVARLDTTFGDGGADYTTLSTGHEYRAGRYLLSTRYEVRIGESADRHFLTTSGAFRSGDAWSYYLRERVSLADPDSGSGGFRAEGLFGAAYRPPAGGSQLLVRADHSTAGGEAVGAGGVPSGTATTEPASSFGSGSPAVVRPGIGIGYDRSFFDRDSHALSLATGARLTARQRLAVTAVARRVSADTDAGLPSTFTHLTSLHYTTQVHERWTVGGSLRRFAERYSKRLDYGYGAELGFLVLRNLWVTGGYNFAGFEDESSPGADETQRGPFVSVRFKFDERRLTQWNDLRLDR
jgi:uncharacterized repeat protein (TIGR01451 family)